MKIESLNEKYKVVVSGEHTFGTDALALADFAGIKQGETAVDLGTGCGIIPLAMMCKMNLPGKIIGIDIQPGAIEQFQKGIELSEASGVLQAVHADLRKPLPLEPEKADVVTCNPPYYKNGSGAMRISESHKIARYEIECTPEDVCAAAAKLLKFGGRFCLVHRPERLCDIMCVMRKYGLEPKRMRFIAKGVNALPSLFLLEGKKGGKSGLKILPSLIVGEGGRFLNTVDK